jgi:hypothetical protein
MGPRSRSKLRKSGLTQGAGGFQAIENLAVQYTRNNGPVISNLPP